MTERAEAILDEWFGELDGEGRASEEKRKRWWSKDPAFDAHVRAAYEADVERALAGECDDWETTARGGLALVILLDQLTRNMFRDSGRMYCGDARAVTAVQRMIERGFDVQLRPAERQFLYMPLMHSEDVAHQDRCVEVFHALRDETGVDVVKYAEDHRAIVARFGRFPHRNARLDRESTAEELAFLKEPGSSF